jgi:hypothetical protein
VVYTLKCKEHPDKFYISETKTKLKRQFYQHRSSAFKATRCNRGVGGIFTNNYKRFEFPEKRMAVSTTTNVLKLGAEPVVQVLAHGASGTHQGASAPPQGASGPPQGASGPPQGGVWATTGGRLGHPRGCLGHPRGRLSHPRGSGPAQRASGPPQGRLSHPIGRLGHPIRHLGHPRGHLGHPRHYVPVVPTG